MKRLEAIGEYRPLFENAYPGERISPQVVAKAISVFERTVVSGDAPFDRFIAGDADAIGPAARSYNFV